MSAHDERLRGIEERIERLALDPSSVRVRGLWVRLARPILRTLGWRPTSETKALAELLALVERVRDGRHVDADAEIGRAIEELDRNVASVERACVVNGRIGTAQAAWLRRLFEVVVRAVHALERGDPSHRRVVAATDPTRLLPPLAVRSEPEGAEPVASSAPEPSDDARLVELQLAAVDHMLDAARDERAFLARRRRLLESARQILLESAAAMPLDETGVEARREAIAREIVRIDRLEAAGLAPDVALLHQARSALARGDRDRLHAALVALDGAASDVFDDAVARRTQRALAAVRSGRVGGGVGLDDVAAHAASIERSSKEAFGEGVVKRIHEGYRRSRRDLPRVIHEVPPPFQANARAYVEEGAETAMLSSALAVDGAFEVGGTLSPVRVTEIETRARAVPWPTQDLVLLPARAVEDIARAVIDDPRTVLLDLATGRLLTRKYVHHERIERPRTRLVGEVRVYLLDGSSSMIGPRARMRDAILVAELATLLRRFEEARRSVRVTLFYRYFDLEVGPVTRVDDPKSALDAIQEVAAMIRVGGTNIEDAVVASLEQIRDAREQDPDLARAQIVLVTDGEAPVREERIEAARAALGDLHVGVSVIALGDENPALRAIVAKQRARGERAFYHFIPDAALASIAKGQIDRGGVIHLPALEGDASRAPEETARALRSELEGLLDELVDLDRRRDLDAIERAEAELRAAGELGVSLDGEGARREAIARDVRAVERRYARWFPPAAAKPDHDAPRDGDVDAAYVVLATVAEVVSIVGGSSLARRAEAIDVLERLLPDAGLSPARYQQVLAAHPEALAGALAAVHATVDPRA